MLTKYIFLPQNTRTHVPSYYMCRSAFNALVLQTAAGMCLINKHKVKYYKSDLKKLLSAYQKFNLWRYWYAEINSNEYTEAYAPSFSFENTSCKHFSEGINSSYKQVANPFTRCRMMVQS